MGSGRTRWLSSTLALALAAIITTVLHELSHAVMGLATGSSGVRLYGYQVTFDEPHPHPALTALTGPVFSLLLGVVVMATTTNRGRGFWRLFWLWFGLVSAENFFGYLVIAPFGHVADTGSALDRLDAPGWVYVVLFVVGVAGILALAARFLTQILRYADDVTDLRRLGVLAWLAGTLFTVLRTAIELAPHGSSDVVPVVLAGAAASAIFAPILTPFYQRFTVAKETLEAEVPSSGVVAFVVSLVVVLGLAFGLPLG